MAGNVPKLTEGALDRIFRQEAVADEIFLQIIEIKPLSRKIKVALSDGVFWAPAIVGAQLRRQFDELRIVREFMIVKLKERGYIFRTSLDRPFLILMDFEIVYGGLDAAIGRPELVPVLEECRSQQRAEMSSDAPSSGHVRQELPRPDAEPVAEPAREPVREPVREPAREPVREPEAQQTGRRVIVLPIEVLNPYMRRFTIRARVVLKMPVIFFSSRNHAEGRLFNVILKDVGGSEIRGTFFNDQVDVFEPMIQAGACYEISGGIIRYANERFNSTGHCCELTFNASTKFVPITDDGSIGSLTYRFKKLADLKLSAPDTLADVIVWAYFTEPVTEIELKKTGGKAKKRRIEVCDDSAKCELTLWDKDAENFPNDANCVISIKDARISSFHGRSLSATQSSIVTVNPDFPEAVTLRAWADSGIDMDKIENISVSRDFNAMNIFLSQINDLQLGTKEEPDYVTIIGVCSNVITSRRMYYPACPTPECHYKGFSNQTPVDGAYICDRCHQTIYQPKMRYNFQVRIKDYTGEAVMTVLGDDSLGAIFTGMTAEEWAQEFGEFGDEQKMREILMGSFFTPMKLKCRLKMDNYQDGRVKINILQAQKITFAEAALFYESEIMKFVQ